MENYSGLYDTAFPEKKKKIKIENKTLNSPWITKSVKRFCKRRKNIQKVSEKKETKPMEKDTRYKTLFKTLKNKFKKSCYSGLIEKYKDNIAKT